MFQGLKKWDTAHSPVFILHEEARYETVHMVWFYLDKVLEQPKLIGSDRMWQ